MRGKIDPEVLRDQVDAELARRSLLDFGQRMYRGFEAPAHLRHLAGLLENVESGALKRLMYSVPPRHGKSALASSIFSAWYLGRHPRANVIIATHGAELSEKNSRLARSFLEDPRWPFEAKLSQDSAAVYRWSLTDGGGCYAVGVGGSVTGRGGDLIILDDIHHDAGTEGERDAAGTWYREVLYPRLEPGGAIVCIGTRFDSRDVFAQIEDSPGGASWHIVRLPAFAEENDALGRAVGKPLWPERVSAAELEDRRLSMGTRAFEAQFQQNPVPLEGALIKADWLSHRYDVVPDDLRNVLALDAAAKTGIANDYSVIAAIGSTKSKHHLLEIIRKKVDFPDLKRMLLAAVARYQPKAIYIEDASNAVALIQELKRETSLLIVPVKALGSKISRVEAITGQLEAGNVLLPREAPWLNDFIREAMAFPQGKFDDQIDAVALGLSQVARRPYVFAGSITSDGSWAYNSDDENAFEQQNAERVARGEEPQQRMYLASDYPVSGVY